MIFRTIKSQITSTKLSHYKPYVMKWSDGWAFSEYGLIFDTLKAFYSIFIMFVSSWKKPNCVSSWENQTADLCWVVLPWSVFKFQSSAFNSTMSPTDNIVVARLSGVLECFPLLANYLTFVYISFELDKFLIDWEMKLTVVMIILKYICIIAPNHILFRYCYVIIWSKYTFLKIISHSKRGPVSARQCNASPAKGMVSGRFGAAK